MKMGLEMAPQQFPGHLTSKQVRRGDDDDYCFVLLLSTSTSDL